MKQELQLGKLNMDEAPTVTASKATKIFYNAILWETMDAK